MKKPWADTFRLARVTDWLNNHLYVAGCCIAERQADSEQIGATAFDPRTRRISQANP